MKLRTAAVRLLMVMGAIVGTVGAVMLWNGGEAEASHGRYFNLSWRMSAPDSADFRLTSAMRRSAYRGTDTDGYVKIGDVYSEGSLNFGDGRSTGALQLRAIAINKAEDWVIGEALEPGTGDAAFLRHTFATPGPWNALYTSCCMIGGLRNSGGDWYVTSYVDLLRAEASPLSSVPPIVTIGDTGVQRWTVPAVHPTGRKLRYRLSTVPSNPQPPGMVIDSATGLVEWDTTGRGRGLYQTSVTIEALDTNDVVVSTSHVVYLVSVVEGAANEPPAWADPTPREGERITVTPGRPLTIHLGATDPDADGVHIDNLGLPAGASFATEDGNPARATLSWVPTREHVGEHLVTVTAQDDRQPFRSATPRNFVIVVPPNAPPTANAGADKTVAEGETAQLDGTASADPDGDTLTSNWKRTWSTGPVALLSSPTSAQPSYDTLDDSEAEFELTVDDGHGERSSDRVRVKVTNAAPVVSAADMNGTAGGATVLAATFSDPGALDTHTARVDWGDGSPAENVPVTQGTGWGSVVAAHRYPASGEFRATVTVTDDDGAGASATAGVKTAQPGAVWINNRTDWKALYWSGSYNEIKGLVHSNAGFKVTGSNNKVSGRAEYGTTTYLHGSKNAVAPVKVPAADPPFAFNFADYKPGGRAALAAEKYTDATAICKSQGKFKWPYPLPLKGLIYVPCDVYISGSYVRGTATIVSTGKIHVSGSGINLQPAVDGLLFLSDRAGEDAIDLSGSGSRFAGYVIAPRGEIDVSGSCLELTCGIVADKFKLSGSKITIRGSDCTVPDGAVAMSTVVPTAQLSVEASRASAQPGETVDYRATLGNAGATLVASGLAGVENVSDSAATLGAPTFTLEYFDVAASRWTALDAEVALTTHPMPSPGVNYAAAGTTLPGRALAAWGYQARLQLSPAQVELLYDPARVSAIRNVVRIAPTGGNATLRPLYEEGSDFANSLRANDPELRDAVITITPPAGEPVRFSSGAVKPGESVAEHASAALPAATERSEEEELDAYLARLAAADGSVLRGSARATVQTTVGRLPVPQARANTALRLPLLTLDKNGPDTLSGGRTAAYDLALENTGSEPALDLAVTDDILGGGSASVSANPGRLEPGERASAQATHVLPAAASGTVTDRAAVRWKDGAGNAYGPIEDQFTTTVVAPPLLSASMRNRLVDDADGNAHVSPGDTVEYEVTVLNDRAGSATNASFTATLDADAPPLSAETSRGTATIDGRTVTATLGTLAGRASATVKIRARVADPLPRGVQAIRAQGKVRSDQTAEVLSDDPDAAGTLDPTITIIALRAPRIDADLTAELAVDTDGNGEPSAGDTLEYRLALANRGDATATGVTFTNEPKGDLTLVPGSVVSEGDRSTDTEVRVELHGMQAREEAEIRFRARIAENTAAAQVCNQGTVASGETQPVGTNNPATEAPADCTVTKLKLVPRLTAEMTAALETDADGNGAVSPGDSLRYAVRVENASGGAATGVRFTATLDDATTGSPNVDLGTIAAGATATHSFVARIADPLPADRDQVAARGRVTSVELAPLALEPTVTEVVRTKAKPPALVAAKTDSLAVDADGDGRVSPGDTLSYEVKVTNVGAGPASDVRFTDTPDRNTTLLAGSVQGATVARGNQPGDTSVDARIGTLAAGAGATLSFQVKIANPLPLGVSVVRNQGQVSSAELGPVLSHDPDSSTTGGMTQTKVALPPVAPPKLGTVGPADGTTVTEPVPVTAGIEPPLGQGIERWCVRYRLAGEPENAARELECGTGTPTGTLATFDPTVLPNGAYIVTVDALSTSGGGIRSNVTLSVEGELKPGRVEQSYEDLALPMANLPMRVLRNYDSFEKRSRDFGHGWSVELSNIRVQVNRELGRGGWSHQATGCSVLLGQNVCLSKAFKDLSSHFVTVTWPDGRSEVFDFTPTAGSGGIYYDASAAFTPRSGATSKLVPEGDPTLQYWGDGNLYEGDGLTLYDPKRFRLTASDGTTYVLETGRGLISAEDRHGNTVRVDADGVTASTGASIKFTRDAQGRITKLTGPSGEQRTYGYDAAGDLVSVTDSRGKTSRYVYDDDHNLTRAEDPDGKPIRRIAYDADGRMSSITDGDGVAVDVDIDVAARRQVMTAGGLTTIVDQDADGNVTSTTEVADGISRATRHEYDSAGNRIRTVDPRGKETRATFDTAGNLLSATDATGRTKRFAYDANNKLVKVTEPDGTVSGQITYDESGDPIVVEHGGGMTTTSTYDGAGRIATTADAMGRTTRYTHDAAGNVETITDPAGGVARFTYDASGRIRTVRDALGALTTYEWDGDGHMVKRTGARAGDVRSFEYDARGRTVAEVDALGKRTTYAYDDASRVSSSTDRNGDTTTFAYDTIGRLQRAGDTTYAYDGFGRMTAAENADARVAFAYDVADRMTGITTTPVSGPATAITYGYDDGGRRTSVTAPWGRSTLSYDPAGQLATLADPVNGTFRWERDAAGRLTKLIRPNGVTSSTSYNLAGQKTAVTHTAASGALVDEARYAYNAGGMPEQVTDRLGTHTYTYDVAGQLTQAVHPAGQPSESYSYDLMGNRTSNGEVYDAAGRLRADAQRTYEYDHEGQLLARTDKATGATTRYAWRDGKLRKVTAADGGVTTYRYDPLGRRIEVSGPAGVVRFGYGSEDNASVEYDAAGARTAVHTFGPVLDQPLATRRGTQSYYPLQEGLVNTVTSVTNSTGAAVERFAYGAFGQPQTGNPRPGATGFSYTAREHDAAAGAYYVRARYLDPEIGRFISEDPLPAGNAYAYAGNSPIAHWDPTGLYTMSEINAERAVEADIRAGYNVGEYGFIYRFMRAAKAMNQASHDLYIGITNNIARRSAQHTAQGYVRGNIAEIELHLSGRIQLRALEQARMLARGGKDELANAINSMSQKNWDKIGKELVESWYQRSLNNPNVPQRMLDDVAKVLDPRFNPVF